MTIRGEVQKLEYSAEVHLFKLDLTGVADDLTGEDLIVRFSNGSNEFENSIVWDGKTYHQYPISVDGFDSGGHGSPPRPKVKVSNIDGSMTALCLAYGDLINAKLTRTRTLAKFLDAVNFIDGNANADPNQHFPVETFVVNQKTMETLAYVEFELRWSFDIQGAAIPKRPVSQNLCYWLYKGDECGWVPVTGKLFDTSNAPCALGSDECSQSITGCELRHGKDAALPIGCFPGSGFAQR